MKKVDDDDLMESDPDWIRAKQEAEKKSPYYQFRLLLDEIEIHLRYGLPRLIFIGWIIVGLLVAILFNMK